MKRHINLFGQFVIAIAIISVALANPEPKPVTQSEDVYITNSDATFMASIQCIKDPELVCGATIVSNVAVLTAADCFGDDWVYPEKFHVKYATWQAISGNQNHLKRIASVNRHPQYRAKQWEYNIAVVRVHVGFDKNAEGRDVLPVQLPEAGSRILSDHGRILGWGYTGFGKHHPCVLHDVESVPIISNLRCQQYYEKTRSALTDETICAGTVSQHGCAHDLGGPLIVRIDGDYILQGIQSSREPCKDMKGRPAVYALLSEPKTLRWIERLITD